MSSNSSLPLFLGDFRLGLRPEGAAETEAEALQQTDPCSCGPHSGIYHSTNTLWKPCRCYSNHLLSWKRVSINRVLCSQQISIFMALQTSWRCFAVENLDSATYKMFLRKRSNITASSLSSPKSKKSVSDEFTSLRLPLIFGFT